MKWLRTTYYKSIWNGKTITQKNQEFLFNDFVWGIFKNVFLAISEHSGGSIDAWNDSFAGNWVLCHLFQMSKRNERTNNTCLIGQFQARWKTKAYDSSSMTQYYTCVDNLPR